MPKLNLRKYSKYREYVESRFDEIKSVYCPALESDVFFNSDGLHHLRYDCNRSERKKKAQLNKFRYFDDAVEIIKKTTTIQEYRSGICPVGKCDRSGFRKTKTVEWFGLFAIISILKRIRIMVVVRRIGEGSGEYHFWSLIPYWKLSNNKRVVGNKIIEDG